MHCKSYSHFFSKKFQHICVSLDLNFNESLTNDVVSFKQLVPVCWKHFSADDIYDIEILSLFISKIGFDISCRLSPRRKNDIVLTQPYHEGKSSLVKFCQVAKVRWCEGWMVGCWMDGQTDRKIMLLSHTLTTRGSHVASLVKFFPVV